MSHIDEELEIEFLEIAISNSGLRERNLPPDIFDKIVEILKTIYLPLRERLALEIVKKLDNGLPVENLVYEAKRSKIEILNEPDVKALYTYRPPARDHFELIISWSGLQRQFKNRKIPSDIVDEIVEILKTMYFPLQEKLARRIAKKLENGFPIENITEEAKKIRKQILIYEKEKKLYKKANKESVLKERATLLKRLWKNCSQDTTDAIAYLFIPFTEEEQKFKGQIMAEDFAKQIIKLMDEGISEKELIAEATNIQKEIMKTL